jgi:hypothetical protein
MNQFPRVVAVCVVLCVVVVCLAGSAFAAVRYVPYGDLGDPDYEWSRYGGGPHNCMVVDDSDGWPADYEQEDRVYSADTHWRTDEYGASGSGSGTMTLYCLIRNKGVQGGNQFEAYVNGIEVLDVPIPVQGTVNVRWRYYSPAPTVTITSCTSFKIRQVNNVPGGTMQVGEVWLWQ